MNAPYKLDRTQQVVWDSSGVTVHILGNQRTGDFELVLGSTLPLSDERQAAFSNRGLSYLGVVAMVSNKFKAAFDVPIAPAMSDAIAHAFLSLIDRGMQLLERMYALQDPRKAN